MSPEKGVRWKLQEVVGGEGTVLLSPELVPMPQLQVVANGSVD